MSQFLLSSCGQRNYTYDLSGNILGYEMIDATLVNLILNSYAPLFEGQGGGNANLQTRICNLIYIDTELPCPFCGFNTAKFHVSRLLRASNNTRCNGSHFSWKQAYR